MVRIIKRIPTRQYAYWELHFDDIEDMRKTLVDTEKALLKYDHEIEPKMLKNRYGMDTNYLQE